MSKNLAQVFIANPVTTIADTDLIYVDAAGTTDAAITGANLKAQFASPLTAGTGTNSALGGDGTTLADGNLGFAWGGSSTEAHGTGSRAWGVSSYSGGQYSDVIGNSSSTGNSADYARASGNNCNSNGQYSETFGSGCTATGNYGVAIGNSSFSTHAGSYVRGDSNTNAVTDTAANQYILNFAGGYQLYGLSFQGGDVTSLASGANSFAFGSTSTTASADNSFAFGDGCVTEGSYSFAFGFRAHAVGGQSMAIGTFAVATPGGSVCWNDNIGSGYTNPSATNEFAINFRGGYSFYLSSIKVGTVGQGFVVAEGSDAKQGIATLVGGTVTVSNTSVTANSRIFLTIQSPGGTVGTVYISSRVVGTSFTITSLSAIDTSDVAYEIFEPAA